jgi:hypothetical protein
MKRTGFLKRRTTRLARVSRKVRDGLDRFAAVYREVDARSGGRCEVEVIAPWGMAGVMKPGLCAAKAVDHHHTRKPRRSFHAAKWIIHLCRRHHDQCAASYRVGRLIPEPVGDGTFTCTVVTKESKWA